MLKKELKLIITFYTSSEAMATERVCKDAGIDIVVAGSYVMNAKDRKERIDNLLK